MSFTGPVVRTSFINWPLTSVPQYYRTQNVYKTTPGTERAETPYSGRLSFYDGASKYGSSSPGNYDSANSNSSQDPIGRINTDYYGLKPRALNRARSRFITSMKESRESSIGSSLAEFDQTLSMIGSRAKQLLGFARNLRRGNLRGAARSLHMIEPPKGARDWRRHPRGFGGLFLEYHFGWSPLLGDIHDGMRLISEPLPSDGRVSGRGQASASASNEKSFDNGASPYPDRKFLSGRFVSRCEIRGLTELVNPNLDLLSSLGLVNPAEIAWELFPFSFLIDHVVGIGDFLHSFSDEVGWRISDLGVSEWLRLEGGSFRSDFSIGGPFARGKVYKTAFANNFVRSTAVALPPHSTEFTNPFTGLSAPRAATYVALLLQVLKS